MDFNKRKIFRLLLLLALQLAALHPVVAQTEPTITRPLLGSEGKFKVDSISFVSDNVYFSNTTPFAPIEQTHRIRNLVSVGIEEESPYYVQTDFTVTVTLNIKKYDNTHTLVDDDDKAFTINYKKGDTARYNAIQYLPFEGAYEVKVKILSIDSGSVTWPVSRVLRVDNQLTATRDYVFSCTAAVSSLATTFDNTNKELTASWADPNAGQTEYDLEWAWIDESALDDYKDGGGNFVQDKLFVNNATRVTISGQSYNIPLMYDGSGRLFVRVRPAQVRYSGQRVEGAWTWQNSGSPVYYSYGGHEEDLNWQASTSFAEEGKRKTVIQYFDGTLRNRQTVTKDNTTNTTVVAESFYDYQGRPVIQILPAPTLSHVIEYSANFNRAINHNQYPKWVYDKLEPSASICGNPAMAFSTSSGTAKYYSPNSDEASTAPGKFIPSSTGAIDTVAYPFTETRFTADGRIAAQGGVGPTHQLGSGHETKYFYEVPAQEELDALFGTDAGEASHYFKNLVKDANGQYSVSYSDMHGRTVATALVADAPLQLDTLTSKNSRNFTKQLIDPETNRVVGRSIISSKPLIVPKAGRYSFHYELNPEQLKLLSCVADSFICYDCLYNLKITITSDCNETVGFPYIVVDSNFTVGGNLLSPECNENGKTDGYFDKTFVIENLPEGSYTICKVLSLSDSAQRIYRDSVFMKYDTCRSFQEFYDHEYEVLIAQSNCNITCESCKTAVGNDFTAFRAKFVQQSGMSEPLSDDIVITLQASYKDALANCDRICNAVDTAGFDAVNSIRQTMLLDVTPPMGQYAKPDVHEVQTNPFNIFRDLSAAPGDQSPYQTPLIYTTGTPVAGTYRNEFGQPQTNPDPRTFGITQFANDFDPAWAEQLLPYHPEFCKLKTTLELLPSTYAFESKLLRTNTWTQSKIEQYTTTVSSVINIVNVDPFFSGPGSSFKSVMISKMGDFSYPSATGLPSNPACSTATNLHPGMWQLAQSAVFCINEATDPCNASSAQNLCLLGTPILPPVNPTTGCATDWDMAWKYFRSLYISYRKQLIARYLKSACNNPDNDNTITTNNYKLRFVDYEHLNPGNMGLGDYATLISQLQAGNPDAHATAHTMELQNYDSTCRGYADTWLIQLQECATIATRWENASQKTTDSLYLVPLLVDICKKGADPYHPLGSSSIAPGKTPATDGTHNYSNFPQVITQFLASIPITTSSTCHSFLINSPKPYDKQQALWNGYVVTKPTQCECDRLSALESDYAGSGFSGTFSAWLKWKHGTTIAQSTIDTIKSLCNGTYPCVFLAQPIVLPPVLQCRGTGGTPVETCIDCGRYNAIKDSFYVKFGYHAPVVNPTTEAEVTWNIAFENFANNETGFAKNWTEYVAFGNTCATSTYSCATLDSLLNVYKAQANPAVSAEVCRQQFVLFFNNFFNVSYTYEQWVNIFIESCGHRPDVCKPTLTCSGLKSYIKQFYDTYGVQVYKNISCSNLFTGFINNKLGGTHYSYDKIDSLYRYLCGVSCSLDVCTFPNCYLLTRAYDKFKAEDVHPMDWASDSCQIRYTAFFNTYFGIDTAKTYSQIRDMYDACFTAGCGPNLSALCLPSYSCTTLNDVLIKFYNVYTYSIDSASNCKDTFAIFFNDQLATSYTWQQIADLYLQICGMTLPACTPGIDCSDMQVVYNDFITNETYDSSNCRSLFTAYFNTHFGTSYTFEGIDSLYSVNCGTLISLCYITWHEPVNCDAITDLKNDFLVLYPNPQSQLGGNCEAVFAAFFNQRFGTAYTYTELETYYLNVCSDTLDICSGICPKYISFYNDFNSRFGWMKLPLDVKKELFAYLFNDQFVTTGARLTFGQIEDLMDTCITGALITGPATQSLNDCDVLFSLKQAFYVMHPNGFSTGGGSEEGGIGMEAPQEDCQTSFMSWFNLQMGTTYEKYFELADWYKNVCGPGAGIICPEDSETEVVIEDSLIMMPTNPPMLCGLAEPVFTPVTPTDDPCKNIPKIAFNAAMEKYELYLDSLRNVFDTAYYNKCMKAKDLESFTVNYDVSEYHYTLYYYDQAGNLVKTVPPAGVDAKHGDATFLANVKTKRQNVRDGGAESSNILTPTHTLATEYRYNTLNQVIAQKTPDAGESQFWYDRLGRLVVSQNAKQAAGNKYSYTLYDDLGRISQVGQKPQTTTMTETISRDPSQLASWLVNNGGSTNVQNKEEITRTVYDVSYFNGEATLSPAPLVQKNLRNRVSYTQVFDTEPSGSDDTKYAGTHRAATYYSYDIHGNVDTLLQDYNSGIMASTGNRYKKMVYDYDLISGKVNKVAYQPGFTDEFYHKYTYDAENRLTDVETSHDGWIWEKDARYSYYKHGPLARIILGQQQVQGLDYAYTLQGWLKGINSTAVGDGTYDMGGDGKTGGGLSPVARDAFGFSLNYFSNDYKPLGGTNPFAAITAPSPITTSGQDLFNGNIGAMGVNIPKLGDAHLYRYRYDQLNRIVAMDVFTGLNSSTNAWAPSATDNYKERISYDPNGNILTYLRNGTTAGGNPQTMDNLTYGYNLSGGKLVNNRLRHVKDAVSSGNYTEDIDNQADDNYTYDQIGNLVGDAAEGISNITWSIHGKILSITKTSTVINYSYDVAGNRIAKSVTIGGNTKTTVYVRDASGNVMSLYKQATFSSHLIQEEIHMYGSNRIGILSTQRDVNNITQSTYLTNIATFLRGNKSFELNNHLSNVLATVADTKTEIDGNTDGLVDYYTANILTANDYCPFGLQMFGRKFVAANSYRYGFNGKEKDNDISNLTVYDYGFRIYNPAIGRFLSVDPLTKNYPHYTPYQFSGNNPIKFIDLDGLEESDPANYLYKDRPKIDMNGAPPSSPKNAQGFSRNKDYFWKQLLSDHPEYFSQENVKLINDNFSPWVDEVWTKNFPTDAEYTGTRLVHHHVEGKNMAVGISEKMHWNNYSELHAYLKKTGAGLIRGAKVSGTLTGMINVVGFASDITGIINDSPDALGNQFQGNQSNFEDYYNKVVNQHFGDGPFLDQYIIIRQVVIEMSSLYNEKGEIVGQYVSSRYVKAEIYTDYAWDEDERKYIGVNRYGTQTAMYRYNPDGSIISSVEKRSDMPGPVITGGAQAEADID